MDWAGQVSAAIGRRDSNGLKERFFNIMGRLDERHDPQARAVHVDDLVQEIKQDRQPVDWYIGDSAPSGDGWVPITEVIVGVPGRTAGTGGSSIWYRGQKRAPDGQLYDGTIVDNGGGVAQVRPGRGAPPVIVADLADKPWDDDSIDPRVRAREDALGALGGLNAARYAEVQRMFRQFGIDPGRADEFSHGMSSLTWADARDILDEFIKSPDTTMAEVVALDRRMEGLDRNTDRDAFNMWNSQMTGIGWNRFEQELAAALGRLGYDSGDIDDNLTTANEYGPDDWWNWWSPDGDDWAERYMGKASDEEAADYDAWDDEEYDDD